MRINDKTKKILNTVTKVITWLLLAFVIFIMVFTIVTVTTVDKNDRSIFGAKFYIVQTDSMSPSDKNKDLDVHFNAGDIVIARELTDKEKYSLKSGDVISFLSTNEDSFGETVTHMIRKPQYDKDGRLEGYVTFGTNTNTDDEEIVEPEYILGQYTGKLPGVGHFFAFVKSTPGYIVCILIPFLLLIIYNGFNVIRVFRRYKAEQNEAIQAEKDQIAEDRRKNEEMLRELMALKEQLAKQSANPSTPPQADNTAAEQGVDTKSESGSDK